MRKNKFVRGFIFDFMCIFSGFKSAQSYSEFFSYKGYLAGWLKQKTLSDSQDFRNWRNCTNKLVQVFYWTAEEMEINKSLNHCMTKFAHLTNNAGMEYKFYTAQCGAFVSIISLRNFKSPDNLLNNFQFPADSRYMYAHSVAIACV